MKSKTSATSDAIRRFRLTLGETARFDSFNFFLAIELSFSPSELTSDLSETWVLAFFARGSFWRSRTGCLSGNGGKSNSKLNCLFLGSNFSEIARSSSRNTAPSAGRLSGLTSVALKTRSSNSDGIALLRVEGAGTRSFTCLIAI